MKKVKKCVLVSAIIKIKCLLGVLDSKSEFQISFAWRLLMSQKKKSLIRLYEDELNIYKESFDCSFPELPLIFFHLPVIWNYKNNRLEVNFI